MEKIDRLLKDKLESYRPNFEEAAWGAFSTKLEKMELPFYKKWFGLYTISGLVLLASGAFLFYFWPTNNEIPISNSAEGVVLVDTVYVNDTVRPENLSSELTENEGASSLRAVEPEKVNNQPSAELAYTPAIPEKAPSENNERQPVPENRSTTQPTQISQKSSENTLHWKDTISEREMMRYLFGNSDGIAVSTVAAHPFEEFGDSFEAKKTNHLDVNAGPLLRLMYPVDGFVTEEEGFLNPGFRVSVLWNKKLSVNIGIQTGNNLAHVENVNELSEERLNQFPAWDDFHFVVEGIRIDTDQLYMPIDIAYHFPVYRRMGVHLKAGVVAHYIRKQEFYYNPHSLASFRGEWAHTAPKSWQISYLQTGLGINYQLSRRFSTHLDGEYWHGIQPIGGEQNRYRRMGLSVGLNFHLLPDK